MRYVMKTIWASGGALRTNSAPRVGFVHLRVPKTLRRPHQPGWPSSTPTPRAWRPQLASVAALWRLGRGLEGRSSSACKQIGMRGWGAGAEVTAEPGQLRVHVEIRLFIAVSNSWRGLEVSG